MSSCSKIIKSNKSTKHIFQEAIDHCRWKDILKKQLSSNKYLQEDKLYKYANNTFYEIFEFISNLFNNITGIGPLTQYDITAAICRYNNIVIDKVFIIGGGPKKTIKLFKDKHNYTIKTYNIKVGNLNLKYTIIDEIIKAFKKYNYEIDFISNNGDDYESFICNWQKGINL
jgi:hypothetical protein